DAMPACGQGGSTEVLRVQFAYQAVCLAAIPAGYPLAENGESYLRRCLEQNICPVCRKPIAKKIGSGQRKDGVFCALDCHGKWHQASLAQRHRYRVRKGSTDE